MELATAMTVATTALSTAQAVHTKKVSDINVKAEKKIGQLRADERLARLKSTLGAQRLAMIDQGSDPDFGSNLVLFSEARKAADIESSLDNYQTDVSTTNIKSRSTSSILDIAGRSGRNLLSASKAKKETKVA